MSVGVLLWHWWEKTEFLILVLHPWVSVIITQPRTPPCFCAPKHAVISNKHLPDPGALILLLCQLTNEGEKAVLAKVSRNWAALHMLFMSLNELLLLCGLFFRDMLLDMAFHCCSCAKDSCCQCQIIFLEGACYSLPKSFAVKAGCKKSIQTGWHTFRQITFCWSSFTLCVSVFPSLYVTSLMPAPCQEKAGWHDK